MAQLCPWIKIRTKQWLLLNALAFKCMCAPNPPILLVYISAKIKLSFTWFLPKSSSSVSPLQAHLAKRKHIGWSSLYAKFISMMSPKCSIVENELNWWRFTLHTFCCSSKIIGCMHCFLSLFSLDNENAEVRVLPSFHNSYAIFSHILQDYHDF